IAGQHEGALVEMRGDEALVVFESVRDGLRAAVEMQARFADDSAFEGVGPLPVGIGLDAGEAVPVEDNYRGNALNIAARLCGLAEAGCQVVSQAGDAAELLEMVRADPPDMVVTDIRMPPTNTDEGLVAAAQLRQEFPSVGVLVLSQYVETHHAMNLLAESPAGIGYVLKDRVANVADFADSVRRVSRGQSVIDPEVVAQLLRRRRGGGMDELTDRERQGVGA